MAVEIELTTLQEDLLKELINISFGLSASLIGDMLEKYVHLGVPTIKIIQTERLPDEVDANVLENAFFLTRQQFRSSFHGETLFIIDHPSAHTLSQMLLHSTKTLEELQIKSAILELTNIMTSACIGQLAELVKASVYFEAPTIESYLNSGGIDYNRDSEHSHVIIIETTLDLQDEKIKGYLYILTERNVLLNILKQVAG